MRFTRRIYKPRKYFSGLSKTKKAMRMREIKKFAALGFTDSKAYVGFKTDIGRKTRKSSYSVKWGMMFPDARSLEERAAVTGVPLKFIRESYNRGMAAWRTGHRPGATQQQWGYARVGSFLLCGKTHYTTDSDLVRKAMMNLGGKKWFARCKN